MCTEMLNDVAYTLKVSSRIKIMLIISLILMFSQSIFLSLSMVVLVFIVLVLYNTDVKFYINTLKYICIWLLLIQLIYIIILGSVIGSVVLIIKLVLIILLIENLILTTRFDSLHSGIARCLSALNLFKVSSEHVSYRIAIFLIYTKYLIEDKMQILKVQSMKSKKILNFKYFVIPSVMLSVNDIHTFTRSLFINHYLLKKEEFSMSSKIMEILFVLLLIVAIVKEVIL